MKTRSRIHFLVSAGLITLAIACSNKSKVQSKQTVDSTVTQNNQLTIDSVLDATNDSAVHLTIRSSDTSVVVFGKLKGPQQHLSVYVPVNAGSRLTAALVPVDSTANIRFAQVFYPGGKANGPFGKEISISLQQGGVCTLIVSHNLMAEGGLTKLFKLHIKLTPLRTAAAKRR